MNKCEGCGLQSSTAKYTGINLLNGHLTLCAQCLAEMNAKNSDLQAILHLLQSRLQSGGSPPPGGPVQLAEWIINSSRDRIAELNRGLSIAISWMPMCTCRQRGECKKCQCEKVLHT